MRHDQENGKVEPIIWNMAGMNYRTVGDEIGKAFSIGKQVVKRQSLPVSSRLRREKYFFCN